MIIKLCLLKPCPFDLGLRKFALDPVVVIFFQRMSKKVLADPVLVNFFWNALDPTLIFFFFEMHWSKKNCKYGIKAPINSHTCIFLLKWKFFHFQKNYKCWINCISKKFTTTGSANTCNFLKKVTATGSSPKVPSPKSNWQALNQSQNALSSA